MKTNTYEFGLVSIPNKSGDIVVVTFSKNTFNVLHRSRTLGM
jgi:hypothetical protein